MSSFQIQNVAVVGGTGAIGTPIVQELVDQGFQVSVLTRGSKEGNLPKGVTIKTVNYDDEESLKSAVAGQDAVVSTLGSAALGPQQQKLADVAFALGVKRFIPSEFGINTRQLQGLKIGQIVAGKTKLVDDLIKKAEQNSNFTWTGLSNGMFFDYLGFDGNAKKVTIVDSGNERFQTTTRKTIAKAVASILKHPQETANQYLSIASFQPTQNEILKAAEELTGSKWTVAHDNSAELQKIGEEKLAKGDYSAFLQLLRAYLYRDGEGHALKDSEKANKLLGLPEEEDLREELKNVLP
ncbi:hypothetical protein N0V93_003088 [Gnomoniopsis smithogilvyi]|uniref:NmrA-like domain-containing protein n=1 Tax=Gnomoniopsis smithogilvyi TaxID=1191159 RepID=A0A9W8YWG2_9PEZI|nr:hypothetical protein N0V93_003088 [Gnomoniopsis smithogilvyi]